MITVKIIPTKASDTWYFLGFYSCFNRLYFFCWLSSSFALHLGFNGMTKRMKLSFSIEQILGLQDKLKAAEDELKLEEQRLKALHQEKEIQRKIKSEVETIMCTQQNLHRVLGLFLLSLWQFLLSAYIITYIFYLSRFILLNNSL